MTTEETKSDGPAVLSSAMLDAFDGFAQSLVAHPHRMTPEMWPKGWLFFEAGWSASSRHHNLIDIHGLSTHNTPTLIHQPEPL